MTVAGQTMSPRTELSSVPYAVRAQDSDDATTLAGLAPSVFSPAAHTHASLYYQRSELAAAGSASVAWSNLAGVPDAIRDAGTAAVYRAGLGLAEDGGQLALDLAAVQRRVGGACPAGQAIRVVQEGGGVVCRSDADNRYAAGTGLAAASSTLAIVAPPGARWRPRPPYLSDFGLCLWGTRLP